MNDLHLLNLGLGSLPLLSSAETRSISAENPNGERGGGAKAEPDEQNAASMLGKGWKVRPCITLEPGTTTTLADIQGPGIIQHIWITVDVKAYRDTILRMYWDDEITPSVEVPLGDFFCNGHGLRYNVVSLPVAVNPSGGFNCYLPMPFRQRARITIENQRWEPIHGFFYQITYALTDIPDNAAYLHAQWRRSMTSRECPEHVICGRRSRDRGTMSARFWRGRSFPTAGGAKAKSSFTWTATANIPPFVAPARKTTSAVRGASVRRLTRPLQAIPCGARNPARCPDTDCTAGTSTTPSASSRA
jgi:hypothetical protein